MARSKTSKDRARKAASAKKALDLRIGGAGYQQIADELGCVVSYAWKLVKDELAKLDGLNREQAEQLKTIELQRLDLYLSSLDGGIRKGSSSAIITALKVQERRSKLLGLNAPERVETTDVNPMIYEMEEALAKAKVEGDAGAEKATLEALTKAGGGSVVAAYREWKAGR